VSKSVWSILAIGAAGLILLALMMQHLAEAVVERERSPYAAAVERRLGAKRIGPVRIEEVREGGRLLLRVRAKVLSGVNKRALADAAGGELWLGALRAGARVDEVEVTLADEDPGVPAAAFVVPPPRAGR
jgi:hypothetical protein